MALSNMEKALRRFEDWERYAMEDEQTIEILMGENGPPNQICLHAQQMGEKYLKGFLAFHKKLPPKSHQLNELIAEIKKINDSFSELRTEARLLSDFYIEARYPGDIKEFTVHDAKEGHEAAKKIKDFVLSKIKS